jgi:hypothetical protein
MLPQFFVHKYNPCSLTEFFFREDRITKEIDEFAKVALEDEAKIATTFLTPQLEDISDENMGGLLPAFLKVRHLSTTRGYEGRVQMVQFSQLFNATVA